MDVDAEKDLLPVFCERCDRDGELLVGKAVYLEPHFVVCQNCGWEAAAVWCPKCEMGIQLNVEQRSSSWVCPDCGTEYHFPTGFYDQPNAFSLVEQQQSTGFCVVFLWLSIVAIIVLFLIMIYVFFFK
ncbi:MAG: hypothetical protein AB8I69_10025 [Anaerolineae bacterium]